MGKKISESPVSPTKVETTARMEKCLPPSEIFMRLITQALRNEPMMKAMKLAQAMRGASPKTKSKVFFPFPEGSCREQHGKLSDGNNEEVHEKSQPDEQAHLAVAPNFGDNVVDDVRNRKTRKPAVMEIGPICTNFVSNRLDATRHTQNTTLRLRAKGSHFFEEDIKKSCF